MVLPAIEAAQGRSECRHGTHAFDDHLTLADAMDHLRAIAADQQQSG